MNTTLAVLVSGGLDSAVLVGDAALTHRAVQPLYVRQGLYWEEVELAYLRSFLAALPGDHVRPVHILELPVRDLYDHGHWSIAGEAVPAAGTPDAEVYLPGRNVLLLAKALPWCHLHGVPAVALGILRGNPFADATPEFFDTFTACVNQALGGQVRVLRPFAALPKTEVMRLGQDLPLHLTFSCIQPQGGQHCGRCNKCEERRKAFADAGLADRTPYAE